MQKKSNELLSHLINCVIVGVLVVLLIVGVVFLFHILVIGALVGLVLFAILYLKQRFFPSKSGKSSSGRVFDQKDK